VIRTVYSFIALNSVDMKTIKMITFSERFVYVHRKLLLRNLTENLNYHIFKQFSLQTFLFSCLPCTDTYIHDCNFASFYIGEYRVMKRISESKRNEITEGERKIRSSISGCVTIDGVWIY
jgi:hypothetical protein